MLIELDVAGYKLVLIELDVNGLAQFNVKGSNLVLSNWMLRDVLLSDLRSQDRIWCYQM